MGRLPISPATSFGGLASLEHFADMSARNDAPGKVHQSFGPDYSRYHAALPVEGMSSYAPNLQELTPPIGYPRPDTSAGGVYGAEKGQENYAGYAYSPYTPEMSPLAAVDDVITTRSGLNISKRLRSPNSPQEKPSRVEKRRKLAKSGTKPVSLKKHIALQRPLSEVISETTNVQVFDVFAHVHRHNDVRKEEALKEGKVKRPLNAFLLYRKHVISFVKKELLSEENKNNQQFVSRICGDSWKMETDEVKAKFRKLAQAEKTRHSQAFPRYKYTPKPGKKPDGDDGRKPERSQFVGISSRPPMASDVGTLSPQMMAKVNQYNNFRMHPEALGMEAMAHQGLYREDAYSCSSNTQPLSTLYGHHYLGQQGLSTMHELGHGWGQEMPPVDGCAPERHPQVELPMDAHLQGDSSPPTDLYIDPSLLPGMDEAAYQYLAHGDGLQGHHGWQPYGGAADDMMTVMPDLDINGAHNAYLRGGQEDWHVEPLDDPGHFSDWMAQDECAGT